MLPDKKRSGVTRVGQEAMNQNNASRNLKPSLASSRSFVDAIECTKTGHHQKIPMRGGVNVQTPIARVPRNVNGKAFDNQDYGTTLDCFM